MSPVTRYALIALGALFCVGFGAMTIAVALRSGFTVLTAIALLIVVLIASGLLGALTNPPEEDED